MKVYNWKTLLITTFGAGCIIIWTALKLFRGVGGALDVLWLLWGLWMVWSGLRASLTKKGFEEDQKQGARGKRVYRKLFGRLAPVMPYSTAIVFFLTLGFAALMIRLLLQDNILLPLWIFVLIMLIPIGYAVWFSWIVCKHMDLEEEQELLQANDPPVMAEDIRSESHEF